MELLIAFIGMGLALLHAHIRVEISKKSDGDEYWWFGTRRKGMKASDYYALQKTE